MENTIELVLTNVRCFDDESQTLKLYDVVFSNDGRNIVLNCKTDGTSQYSGNCTEELFKITTDKAKNLVAIDDNVFLVQNADYNILIEYYENINKTIKETHDSNYKVLIAEKNKHIENLYEVTVNFLNLIPKELFYDREKYQSFEFLSTNRDIYSEYYQDINSDSETEFLNKLRDDKNYFNAFSSYADKFKSFAEIIQNNFNYSSDYSIAIAWLILKENAIKYFSKQWYSEYGYMIHCDVQVATFNEYIQNYCLCQDISHKDIHIVSLLTYYLMDNKKFENNSNYLDCNGIVINSVLEMLNKIDQKQLTQYLFNPVEKNEYKYRIEDVDLMNGVEFENFLAELFTKMGFSTELTKASGDQGIDVIAIKGITKVGVQAKCYSNTVGNSAIQEATAGKKFYNCNKVIVATNNFFSNSAQELASVNDVILWDRNILKSKISELF